MPEIATSHHRFHRDRKKLTMSLIKSKKRVADHGEVFTPQWLVENMLDLVKGESERIDSRFLEPAFGSGNFLVPVLQRKLAAVEAKFGKNDFERRHYALLGVMCTYGIELLPDNIAECRANIDGRQLEVPVVLPHSEMLPENLDRFLPEFWSLLR
jgi:hypothetical protein